MELNAGSVKYQMMTKVLYKEEQRYKKPRITYIISVVAFMLIIDMVMLTRHILSESEVSAGNSDERVVLVIVTIILVLFTSGFVFVFTRMRLITVITESEIQVSYPPLYKKGRAIPKEAIERFEVREYNPRMEYGGWGFKARGRFLRRKRFGDAFTAYGRTGVQFYLHDGKKILIGTQRAEPFKYALNKMLDGQQDNEDTRKKNTLTQQKNG